MISTCIRKSEYIQNVFVLLMLQFSVTCLNLKLWFKSVFVLSLNKCWTLKTFGFSDTVMRLLFLDWYKLTSSLSCQLFSWSLATSRFSCDLLCMPCSHWQLENWMFFQLIFTSFYPSGIHTNLMTHMIGQTTVESSIWLQSEELFCHSNVYFCPIIPLLSFSVHVFIIILGVVTRVLFFNTWFFVSL